MKTNWQTKKLGEICDIKTGKKDVNQGNPSGQYPFFTCAREHTYSDKYSFDMEAILVAGNGDVGHVSHYNGKFEAYQRTYILHNFKDLILTRFLHLFLDGYLKATVSKQKLGNTMPYIKMGMLTDFKIPVPPLSEQKLIVKILDEAFEKIEKAKENTENNLKNSKELFESYLQSVFANPKKDWEEKILGEVCSLITKGSSPKWQGIKYVEEPGILFITSENVGDRQLILDKRKYVEQKFNKKDKKSILQKGDVLTNIVGASIGRTAIFDLDDVSNINQAVCILRCKPEVIFNKYLMNLLNSPFLKIILHSNEVNTARANLSLGFFSNLSIPLPLLAEQKSIVKKLDSLSEQTKKLEGIYKQKLADLEELKKSVLNKAFSGEL